ncbi:hypothetical protein LOTGIDRAFT_136765 [Lottia gigantea]|uniref:diacylglycerol cholinephosphotransferase n=1 Tax=Lottia gigantea TaxID=225164 RepID=V4B1C2_LOTGI|nr:hypothetical protein LOTGIDRAFT_136765 [Lottia gigantea]ESP04098.1 hypothetical protein LOTGIDRAFT_136765 [Lottia gigantea]
MTVVLSTHQLQKLSEHKYSAEGTSVLEPGFQVFWRWLVEKVPLWLAPNTITSVGLAVNILTTMILVFYSPDAKHHVPGWAYILCGLGLFIYQSLDAIDGKQARRTKTNSPLGELFDHGCDSVSTVFVLMGTCIALKLGNQPNWMMFEIASASFLFYCAHWQTYVSGTLKFGKIDVTEGQVAIIGLYFITGIFGEHIWELPVPVFGSLKFIPIYISIGGAILQLNNNFSVILMKGGIGRNGSTVAGTSTIFPVFPISLVLILEIIIQNKSPTFIYHQYPALYLLSFGLLAAKVTNKLVVAHMTKSEMELFDLGLIGPGMLFLNQYFNCIINEYIVLWLCFIWCLFDLIKYSTHVCIEICDYLNIYCFTITSTPKQQQKGGQNGKNKSF